MSVHRFRRSAVLAAIFLAGLTALSASAVDRVIFRDGFYLEGVVFKEQETIDAKGVAIRVPKLKGFDVLDDDLRWWIFSRHQKQAVEVQKDIRGLEDIKEYKRPAIANASVYKDLPAFAKLTPSEFDAKWERKLKAEKPDGNWQTIEQVVAALGPQRMVVFSKSHRWNPYISTRELGPAAIRKLLVTHPDLDEKGKPDASKRLLIAKFFYQGDFLDAAREEIERAKKDIPGAWTKEQTETLGQLEASLGKAQAKLVVDEVEVAKLAGRYEWAKTLMTRFDAKAATADLTNRFTKLKAEFETVQSGFAKTRPLLAAAIDRLSGGKSQPVGAVLGGVGVCVAFQQLPDQTRRLVAAGGQVAAELHPENADRIEIFRKLAEDADRDRAAGRTGKPVDRLLALAVSGWAIGPNGAVDDVEKALRLWQWREFLLAYQTESTGNGRRALFAAMQKAGPPAAADLLSQIIKYLPPPQPDDLSNRGGVLLSPGSGVVPGVYRRNTGSIPEAAGGVDYLIRLPAEYHHGRSYPVLLALAPPHMPAEAMLSLLSYEGDRNGFILAAPLWSGPNGQGYDWSGDDHYKALATVRDLSRHYHVDNDRVSLFGFSDGANFAMDLGVSHPDRFAGLIAMGPTLPKNSTFTKSFWRNLQKLPTYVAVGAVAGAGLEPMRAMYEEMVFRGYPAIASVYRGRAVEWFGGDLHLMFDWVRLKKRVTGVGVLRLNNALAAEPFMTMRANDNRFYWVGSDNINPNNLANGRAGGFPPASIKADIVQGNQINVTSFGMKSVNIWLDREMIDWTKPVTVRINGDVPRGFKPKVLPQDVDLMLEQFYEHGDRSMLFLHKLTISP